MVAFVKTWATFIYIQAITSEFKISTKANTEVTSHSVDTLLLAPSVLAVTFIHVLTPGWISGRHFVSVIAGAPVGSLSLHTAMLTAASIVVTVLKLAGHPRPTWGTTFGTLTILIAADGFILTVACVATQVV